MNQPDPSSRSKTTGTVAALLLAGFLVALAACGGPDQTPEERIRSLIASAEEAAEARDASALADLVSDEYRDPRGYDRPAVLRIVQGVLLRNRQVHLFSVVRNLSVNGEEADGTVLVAMTGQPVESTEALVDVRADLFRFDVRFAREDGEWRVRTADWRRADASDFL